MAASGRPSLTSTNSPAGAPIIAIRKGRIMELWLSGADRSGASRLLRVEEHPLVNAVRAPHVPVAQDPYGDPVRLAGLDELLHVHLQRVWPAPRAEVLAVTGVATVDPHP